MKKRLRIHDLIHTVMRISVYQLLFATLLTTIAFAKKGDAQEIFKQKISLDAKQQPVAKVLLQIEQLADVKFIYISSLLSASGTVDVQVKDQPLGKVLDDLLAPFKLNYQLSGRQIILNRLRESAEALAAVRISGKVNDDKGMPLPGVSVKLKGSSAGATTDATGTYAFNIPEYTGTLVFSYVGFSPKEVDINGQNIINVVMELSATSLNDIVVVGYGAQKKESLTGAIASVNSTDLNSIHAGGTVSAGLAGKIAGVSFRLSDGRPGASASIQIRNMGNPLYVIDGIQQDEGQFNNIAPNDIESITVLKDASAAIYGLRAANGVVVVTTKRGKLGSRNTINVNVYRGWQNWTRFPKTTNAYEWMLGKADAEMNQYGKTSITPDEIAKWKKGTDPGYKSFDWYNFIVKKNAPLTQMNLNFSGGSDRINYYVSATHLKQYSVLGREFTFERTNIQSNVEARVSDNFKIGAQINGRIETRDQPGVPGTDDYWEARFAILRNTPIERPYANDNPNYPNDIGHNNENWALQNKKLSGYWHSDWRVLQSNLTAEYKFPVTGLTARGLFSYYYANEIMNGHEYTYDVFTFNPSDSSYKITGGSSNPYRERRNRTVLSPTVQVQLNYNKAFGLHTIGATVVAERIKRRDLSSYVHSVPTTNDLPLIYFSTMDTYNDADNTEARLGYIGRANYNYANKYFIEVSARRDASWKFSPDKRWGTFPAISGGWRVTEEKFIQSWIGRNALSDLKLRASYGKLGDDDVGIGAYDYLSGYNYNASTVILDGKAVIGSSNKGVPIRNISWFISKTLDIGADFGILHNKVTGTVDYFNRKRTGLLGAKYDILVPSELGYSLPSENVNSDQVSGAEASLAYSGKVNDVKFNIGGNISYARAKTLHTYKPVYNNSLDHYRNSIEERYTNSFWGYEVNGQFQSQEQINNYKVNIDGSGNKTLLPGDLIYKDQNNDGIINDQDQRPIGYGTGRNPIINFGINLSVSWHGFDARADFSGGSGYSFNRNYELRNPYQNGGNLLADIYKDRWHREDPFDLNSKWIPGKYPALRFNNGGHSNYANNSTFWLINVHYLRARTLELGYTVPKHILSKAKIEKARFYINGFNLFSLDNMHNIGIDAEIADDNGLTYPQSKYVNVGFELSF
jgi:TonB-linked SusC/RagA family outer membrane protein